MGISVLNNTSTQELRVQAGTTISSGDLVCNTSAGNVMPASALLTIAQNNNTTAGISAITGASSVSTVQSGTNYGNNTQKWVATSCELGNGLIATLYSGNGLNATTSLTAVIRNVTKTLATSIAVTGDASISAYRVRRVNSTSFVVAWLANATLKFAIYSNDGTVVKAATTVGTLASANSWTTWYVNVLSNGSIVFAYDKVTSRDCETIIYDSTGTIVGTAITTEAAASPAYIIILPQSSGGFIVYYKRSATTAAYKFARYNATGTLQGTLTTVYTGTQTLLGPVEDNAAIELLNGNFVLQAPDASSYPRCYVYSSTGTSVASAIDLAGGSSTYFYPGYHAGICATSSGFAAAGVNNSNNVWLNTYLSNGTLSTYRLSCTSSASATNQLDERGGLRLFNIGNYGFVVATQSVNQNACVYYYDLKAFGFDTAGTLLGSAVTLQSQSTNTNTSCSFFITSDGSLSVYYKNDSSTGYMFGTYTSRTKSLLGVAQESATVGQTLRVGTVGAYTINQSFGAGGAFDQRTATVPGVKGIIVGTTAILTGIV